MNHDGASDHDPRQGLKPENPPSADLPEDKPHPEYRIDIYRDWCKGCGICAAFCPRQCLGLDAERQPGGGKGRTLHRLPLVRTALPGFCHLRPGSGKAAEEAV